MAAKDLDRLIRNLIDRPRVYIDSVPCELKAPGELTVLEHYQMVVFSSEFRELAAKEELTSEEQEGLRKALLERTNIILEHFPQTVREKLSDLQRMELIEVFTLLLPLLKKMRTVVEATKNRIGASLFHACSASMAALRAGG